MSLDLAGKRCVVTGGGTGIGAAIARRLASSGAHVAVLGRRIAPLQETAAAVQAMGRRGCALAADVTKQDEVVEAIARANEFLGGIDCLINNAGVGGPNACAMPGPERWHEVLATNLDGVFHVTRAALPHLPEGGRIVNISSVLGKFGVPGYTAYCTSKHGLIGFGKALALELASRRITVNTVCPGWVETDMAQQGLQRMADGMQVPFAQAKAQAMSAVPLGRILVPDEIAATVAWLCSDDARGMTGQAISHCGGQVMW